MEKNYTVNIVDMNGYTDSNREKVRLKTNTFSTLYEEVLKSPIVGTPTGYAVLQVHNEKRKNGDKDYMVYVIRMIDSDGVVKEYATLSQIFFDYFYDIYHEMETETEPWQLEVSAVPSQNNQGKMFLSCRLL